MNDRLGYRPGLDAVRGAAALAVVISHSRVSPRFGWSAQWGETGVTVFFVLSGFLITMLALEERDDTGTLSLRHFFARRALRLFPVLATFLIAVSLLTWTIGYEHTVRDLVWGASYVSNWLYVSGGHMVYSGHVWSLAIEEQFYLTWPLVLLLLPRQARRIAIALGAASVVAAFVLFDGDGRGLVYYASHTRAFSLLAGCWLAYAVRDGRRVGSAPIGAVLVAVGVLGFGPLPWRLLLSTVGAMLLITGTLEVRRAPRWLLWCGVRAYGIYLWHYPIFRLAETEVAPYPVRMAGALILTLLLTELSWRFVEQPFLRIKSRMRPPASSDVARVEVERPTSPGSGPSRRGP